MSSLNTIKDAADRCCEAAKQLEPSFSASIGVGGTARLQSSAVQAEIPAERNPGADNTEWICTVQLEGIHAAIARMPQTPREDDSLFS